MPHDAPALKVAATKGYGAEVIVYDRLVSPRLLEHAREDAELVYVGKISGAPGGHDQAAINALLVEKAREGRLDETRRCIGSLNCLSRLYPHHSGEILFEDHFDDSGSGWVRWEEMGGGTDYGEGVFRIWVDEVQTDYWSTSGHDFDDVRVASSTFKAAGPDDNRHRRRGGSRRCRGGRRRDGGGGAF